MSKEGDWIKEVRKSLGLSREKFAKKIDYPVTAVQNWETGLKIPRQRAINAVNALLEEVEHETT